MCSGASLAYQHWNSSRGIWVGSHVRVVIELTWLLISCISLFTMRLLSPCYVLLPSYYLPCCDVTRNSLLKLYGWYYWIFQPLTVSWIQPWVFYYIKTICSNTNGKWVRSIRFKGNSTPQSLAPIPMEPVLMKEPILLSLAKGTNGSLWCLLAYPSTCWSPGSLSIKNTCYTFQSSC